MLISCFMCCFFCNDTATTEIYTLSLHDALPIFTKENVSPGRSDLWIFLAAPIAMFLPAAAVWLVVPFAPDAVIADLNVAILDRKSTRLNSSHANISYAVFCLKKKKNHTTHVLLP